jgi:hypothetical protein
MTHVAKGATYGIGPARRAADPVVSAPLSNRGRPTRAHPRGLTHAITRFDQGSEGEIKGLLDMLLVAAPRATSRGQGFEHRRNRLRDELLREVATLPSQR